MHVDPIAFGAFSHVNYIILEIHGELTNTKKGLYNQPYATQFADLMTTNVKWNSSPYTT